MNANETTPSDSIQEKDAKFEKRRNTMITILAVLGMSAFLGYAALRASIEENSETFM
ncbi:MAG: hypothetical protein QNJ29_12775 [Rhizobiaceae bacterium]|nr:hypothetical protein [Rhizobiaceae bacterium]